MTNRTPINGATWAKPEEAGPQKDKVKDEKKDSKSKEIKKQDPGAEAEEAIEMTDRDRASLAEVDSARVRLKQFLKLMYAHFDYSTKMFKKLREENSKLGLYIASNGELPLPEVSVKNFDIDFCCRVKINEAVPDLHQFMLNVSREIVKPLPVWAKKDLIIVALRDELTHMHNHAFITIARARDIMETLVNENLKLRIAATTLIDAKRARLRQRVAHIQEQLEYHEEAGRAKNKRALQHYLQKERVTVDNDDDRPTTDKRNSERTEAYRKALNVMRRRKRVSFADDADVIPPFDTSSFASLPIHPEPQPNLPSMAGELLHLFDEMMEQRGGSATVVESTSATAPRASSESMRELAVKLVRRAQDSFDRERRDEKVDITSKKAIEDSEKIGQDSGKSVAAAEADEKQTNFSPPSCSDEADEEGSTLGTDGGSDDGVTIMKANALRKERAV